MNKLILLIDEEILVISYYIRALKAAHYDVRQKDLAKAFEYLENEKPDLALIVLDIMMPPEQRYDRKDTMDGLRTGICVYEEIRNTPQYANTPIIVLTNVSNSETLEYFNDKPCVKVVQKLHCDPFDLVELVQKMVSDNSCKKLIPSDASLMINAS